MRSNASTARPRRSDHRLHRRLRTALTALVLGAVAAGGGAVVTPAEAATTAPSVKLVGGDRAITAAWSAVPGATSYTVRVSTRRSLSSARVVTTSKRTLKIAKLRNGSPYFVGVTANRPVMTPAVVRSAVATATAARGVPYQVTKVSATPGPGVNQVRVSWTGGGRALKVGVIAGSSVAADHHTFHSAWYPATTRSIVLTVPSAYRSMLGGGTGNPLYVRVAESNSGSTGFHPSYDAATSYRTSPLGTWAFPKADVPSGAVSKLRVAEWNTQTNGATQHYSASNRWAARLPRVAAMLRSVKPQLFMTAELATNADPGASTSCSNTGKEPYRCGYLTQYQELAKAVAPQLQLADLDAYSRVLDLMRSNQQFNGHVTDGAHVFYDPAALQLLDHGYLSPALTPQQSFANVTGLGVPGWMATAGIGGDRWLTWAKFRTLDGSGREFYAAAAHFPVGDATAIVARRADEARLASSALRKLAGGLPVVFGGDLNSDPTRSAHPAQQRFIADGWFDSAAVSPRSNMRYNTTNSSGPQTGSDAGYPKRPYLQKWATSRIDYILLLNSPHSYRYDNFLPRTANGDFDRSRQGSDHNLQLAQIGIGDPVS